MSSILQYKGFGLAAALALTLAGSAQAQASPQPIFGVWRNHKDSVHIDIRPCGTGGACGYVIWADEDAKEDARRGGTQNLVGLQLFRNFAQSQDGAWHGKVFVPDLNATFSGGARTVDAVTLKARGCLIGNLVCRSQTWTRLGAPG